MTNRRPGFGVLCAVVALGVACVWPAAATAQERFTRAEEDEFHRAATRALAHGEYDEARALAGERDAADPSSAALLARLDVLRGEYEAAEARLAPVAEANPISAAGLELALVQQYLGRRDEAAARLRVLVDRLQRSPDAVDLYRAARAARALGRYRQANTLLRNAAGAAPDDPAIETLWGDLFGEKYDQAEASQSYIAALEIDEEWAPALLGMARALADTNPPQASAAASRAIEIDPDYLDAHLFLAQRSLDDRDHEAGRASLERALAINDRSLEARSLLAAVAYVEDRLDDFEAEVQRVLDINPTYGEVHRVAGNLTARNYRFEEAAALVRRGLEIDPANTRAYAELGMHLLRTGDEPGARRALERSFEDDPYDVITFNLLEMLDTLDEFETFEEGDLIVRLHPDEAPVLKDYVIEIGQRSLDELSARYGMEPEGPILIEVFPQHDHFAVRTLGLPGMIGALGACFGKVVTLDSPRARSPGDFNWESTLWHEMAHVIALQMSNQRVPRWLTEGLSTYEEKRARADWARDQDLEFATNLNRGDVLSLRDLNAGFSRPETISIAYFQASVLVEHMIEAYGESTIYDLLRAYGEGLDTEAALDRVGLDFDTLQASFDAFLEVRFGALRRAMENPEQPGSSPEGVLLGRRGDAGQPVSPQPLEGEARLDQLRELGEEHPGSYPVQMSLGHALWADGDAEAARAAFERAAALAPMATGDGSAHLPLAAIALEQEDRERAMGHLEAHLEHDHRALAAARQLAVLAEEAGDDRRRRRAYELVAALDPFDAEPHQSLGRLAMAAGDTATAVREFSIALAAGPIDRVSAHVDLANGHLATGDLDAARREVIAALEIAPTYERAQEMLLDIVEAGL
ncbi:MAG: tetratricopeptide repeat protein [Acidobacteria bacterium]|nr:tetratricopeptide repeat protein [Acidobacteriota bacterium]